ncbi:MAG: M14 family metallopeptidase [Verrucomicrobiota bacterium]|nr:M14 family metallopeptidase [Verrucomicrobiota bacterium]
MLIITSSAMAAPEAPALDYYLPVKTADYDPAAPAPQQALGFQIGEWHLHHHELVQYLQKLDAWSDRITLREYARSHGRRPLIVLTITAPNNHARIEEIRRAHVDRQVTHEAPAKDAPIVVWMGYSVHGNEPSGGNAAVLLAYHLAAARDPATAELLQNAVVLLEPCLNPDGFERFANWTNSLRGQVPGANRADREHQEAWPGGRSNYYWFDLNRDWLPAVMPESQGRLKLFHEWEPNIVTDFHEMGNVNSSYFFQPGIAKMVNPLVPPRNQELTKTLAREHGRALDAIGSLYYSGESFDDFYPGKGSTYPDLNGSVGVLFEQAGSRGFHQDTEHGRLTFPFTIRNQLTTSLSTLRAASSERSEFLNYQTTFYREAADAARASKTLAYVFASPGDRSRMGAFIALLDRHRIQHGWLAGELSAGGHTFAKHESLVVPVQQRQYRLLTAMFERRTEFPSFIFYDVSGWHIPSAYGMLSAELDKAPATVKIDAEPLARTIHGPEKAYAYAFAWEPRFAPRALFRLLQAKARCWVATRPIATSDGLKFNPGSIVVPVSVQEQLTPEALRTLMKTIAHDDQLEVQSLATGMTSSVPDLGSPSMKPVTNTGVLLVTGAGVTAASAGDVWFQFDQVWQTPLAKVDAAQLSQSTLKSFSTVILTGAPFSGLPSGARTALESWVSRGGTLIAIGSSVSSLASEKWASETIAKPSSDATDEPKPATDAPAPSTPAPKSATPAPKPATPAPKPAPPPPKPGSVSYAEADERRAEREVKGAVVRATFDATHPLVFGYSLHQPHIEFLRTGTTSLKPASNAYLNPLRYTDDLVVAGFISTRNRAKLQGTPPIQLRESGSGRVVFFTDNPVFRGHWLGTEKLLANAIFFSPLVKTGGGDVEHEEK